MKKVAVVGCGAYMESGYGCPGEWRCLKAAALGEHSFDEPASVVSFVSCECPGRSLVPTLGLRARRGFKGCHKFRLSAFSLSISELSYI